MKIGLICSHGGHLTEMLELREAFAGHAVFYVTYRSERAQVLAGQERVYQIANIGVNPFRLLQAAWQGARILIRERPDVLVSTGAEIAIPFFYLAWLLRIPTIYLECSCRVITASRAGRLVYPIASAFLVQWESLLQVYGPKSRYVGGLL
jgi:UDP-N-acetylglucosamine:LPS N-acetylglucosamine transferase